MCLREPVATAQDGNPERIACRALTMGVYEGECFGLLGPNGAGGRAVGPCRA